MYDEEMYSDLTDLIARHMHGISYDDGLKHTSAQARACALDVMDFFDRG